MDGSDAGWGINSHRHCKCIALAMAVRAVKGTRAFLRVKGWNSAVKQVRVS